MGLVPQGLGVKLLGWHHKGWGQSCGAGATRAEGRAEGEALGLAPQWLGVKLWGWCH